MFTFLQGENNMKNSPVSFLRSVGAGIMMLALASCAKQDAMTGPGTTSPGNSPIPKSPGTIIVPAYNQMTAAKIELGRHLFFEKQLSVDGTTSCGSCHDPGIGFADMRGLATSMGFEHQMGTRNAPSLANIAYNSFLTWDGRFQSLEAHAPGPIFNQLEMGNNFSTSPRDTVPSGYNSGPGPNDTLFLFKRLMGKGADINGKNYSDLFMAAYGVSEPSNMAMLTNAIACFERTFISTNSTFDRFNNGDQSAYKYNPKALHGFQLFTDAKGANCVSCHAGYSFTDQQFHDNGIGHSTLIDSGKGDIGRAGITKKDEDRFAFKTPSLRNVALTAPYMHDGRFKTLNDVLDHYNKGGVGSKTDNNQDQRVRPLNLSQEDISDIIAFLTTLNDDKFTVNTSFANPWNK
jgi:cytochrome c peroxidase